MWNYKALKDLNITRFKTYFEAYKVSPNRYIF
jgi:hypothetical protein